MIKIGTRIQKLDKKTWSIVCDDGEVIRKTKEIIVVKFRNETIELRLNKTGTINQTYSGQYNYQPR